MASSSPDFVCISTTTGSIAASASSSAWITRSGPSAMMRSSSSVTIVAISTIWSRVWSSPVISRSIHTSIVQEPSGTWRRDYGARRSMIQRVRRGGSGRGRAAGSAGPARTPPTRRQAPPTPERRARHVGVGEASGALGEAPLELAAVGEDLALRRRPGGELAVARPAGEVVVALVRRRHARQCRAGGPGDAGRARRTQRRRAGGVELAALGAVVVGEEHDRAVVDAAGEHGPGIGVAVEADGGDGHRVGLGGAGGAGIVVPAPPLLQRIGGDVGDVESRRLVLGAPRAQSRRSR